jgi:hypothetical protein
LGLHCRNCLAEKIRADEMAKAGYQVVMDGITASKNDMISFYESIEAKTKATICDKLPIGIARDACYESAKAAAGSGILASIAAAGTWQLVAESALLAILVKNDSDYN